jgi:hypothetical protein
MKQSKLAGLVLLALGVVLLLFGFNASDSPVEGITEAFTGRYSDSTMLYLIGGGISAVLGLGLLIRK